MGLGDEGCIPEMSMPSRALSDTARLTVLRVSFTVSVMDFWRTTEEEKAARGAEAAAARGIWVATLRVATVKADMMILYVWCCVVSQVLLVLFKLDPRSWDSIRG